MKTLMNFIFTGILILGSSLPIMAMSPDVSFQGNGPIYFVENIGQFAEQSRYQVLGAVQDVYLARDAIWYTLNEPGVQSSSLSAQTCWQVNIKVSFSGANSDARMEPFNRLSGHLSYFKGSRDSWRSDVPVWGGVRYIDLYRGIDLVVTGSSGRLVLRLICMETCQENLAQVRTRVEGFRAAELRLDLQGQPELDLDTRAGKLKLPLLSVPDNILAGTPWISRREGQTIELANPFTGPIVRNLDTTTPSTQAGRLVYSTFLGGDEGEDTGYDIQVDANGAAYVIGGTNSPDFPVTPGAFDPYMEWLDSSAFVSKLDVRIFSTVSATISTAGGSLYSESDHTSYVFPAQTFAATAVVTHTIYTESSVPSSGLLTGIYHFFSASVVYSGSGNPAEPAQLFTITVQYDEAELRGVDEDTLGFYAWDGQNWVKQTGSVLDTVLNTIAITESDFKFWAVLGQQKMIFLPVVQK